MPQVAEGIYAQYVDSVIKLAKRPGGVSKPEIMKGLSVSRNVADSLVDKARLRRAKTVGRTDFFKPTKATKTAGEAVQQEETHVTDETLPTTEEGLLAALVGGDDQPASTNNKTTGKNRLPTEEQTNMVQATTAPATATPPTQAASAPTAQQKNELDAEIKAIRGAITEAGEKARKAQETYVVQTAHVNALGAKLQRALEARLLLG